MREKQKKLKRVYKRYLLVLTILSVFSLIYVYFTLKTYEKYDGEKYLVKTLSNLSDDEIKNYFNFNSNYESEKDSLKNIKKFIANKDYTYKKVDDLTYDVYHNDDKLLKVTYKSLGSKKKLGLLKYDILELNSITKYDNNGIYYLDVLIPSDYTLLINGKNIVEEPTESQSIKGLEEMGKYVKMPKINEYIINNLTEKPTVSYKNSDGKINKVEVNNNTIDLSGFPKYDTADEAKIDTNIMEFAENWSLFLTKDLTGSNYGFSTIAKYFITNSTMYNKASLWAHGIDITFTSKHTLKDPTFTNEKVNNFIVYNDEAFSCEVYLEKNMVVNDNDKIDYFHSRLDYVKINNEWKVVNIEGV